MSASPDAAETALRVADQLKGGDGPWDVFGESIRRYELHLNGDRVEMLRGPITVEGFGYREIRPSGDGVRIGFAASCDLTERGIARAVQAATRAGEYASFPAKGVELPYELPRGLNVETVDPSLWGRPAESIEAYVSALLAPFSGRPDPVPSFGSVRVTLSETTLANSAGAFGRYPRTTADLEFAIRASGGPEGAPAGEYWVDRRSTRLDPARIGAEASAWAEKAKDARRAAPARSGSVPVVLPPEVLADILPTTLGFRFSASATLRGMSLPVGELLGHPSLTLRDDGLLPFGLASAPWDDEGTPRACRTLLEAGRAAEPNADLLHGNATGRASTGSARRDTPMAKPWYRFPLAPSVQPSTIVLAPGGAGSDAELLESIGEGVWIEQLGQAFPDGVSTAFGGEIRLGYAIRGGRLAEPIRGGTVGGVALAGPGQPSLLASMELIGREPRLVEGLQAPTVGIRPLSISGP